MRELRDREDVDEVEEQLDRGRLLRLARAARPQVADRRAHRRVAATIRCGSEVEQRPARMAEAVREQPQVTAIAPAEVVDEQIRQRQDDQEQPDDRCDDEQGKDDDGGEDRQRRAHQEPEEHDGRHLDAAERAGGYLACHQGVVLELLGGE